MTAESLTIEAPETRFKQLDQLIRDGRRYWQFRPFSLLELPWRRQNPALCHWLEQLDDDTVTSLEQSPAELSTQLTPFIHCSKQLWQLCQLPCENPQQQPLPAWLSYHIPGRKWQQVQAFEQALDDDQLPFLEWCAGKGHLGRLLAFRRGQPVRSLELNTSLCDQGEQLAAKHQLKMRFLNLDAMGPDAVDELAGKQHAVALHACGDLHLQLIRKGSERQLPAISLSPCCYHLIADELYQPLSDVARASGLQLDHHDLRLPLQETVTGGQRIDRLRHREVSWRLGFDLLQRQLRNSDQYLNTPSIRKSLLSGQFEEYCRWVAERKQLTLPPGIDYSAFEQQGYRRYRLVQRMELVRHLFRRPLELWLVLDRALYLQQQGYRVELSEFCQRRLTPRNLLIRARLGKTADTRHPVG